MLRGNFFVISRSGEGDGGEEFGAMEIGGRSVDRRPREVMRQGCGGGAFVEVGSHFEGLAFVFHSDERQGYDHEDVPREDAFKFFEGACAARGVDADLGELLGCEARGVVAVGAVRGVDGSYAVEFEIPVLTSGTGSTKNSTQLSSLTFDWLVKFSARRKLQRTKSRYK